MCGNEYGGNKGCVETKVEANTDVWKRMRRQKQMCRNRWGHILADVFTNRAL